MGGSRHPALSAAIRPAHEALDGHRLSQRVMAGRLTPREWAAMRSAWLAVLLPLDDLGMMGPAARSPVLLDEFAHVQRPTPVKAARHYADLLARGTPAIAAHVWVAYAGLVYGGQIQRDKVPPPHGLYDFGKHAGSAAKMVRLLAARGNDNETFHGAAIAAFEAWHTIYDELERDA